MTLGSAVLSIGDGGLGIAGALRRPVAVVGCSSAGTVATPVQCSTPEDVITSFGYGPLAETLALILALAGGPVVGVRATGSTAAVLGTVAQGGAGSSASGTMSASAGNTSAAVAALTGTPDQPYAVKVVVTTAGANLAAVPVVQISLDGGVTYLAAGAVTASATPQAIGSTGLLLAFVDGSFVLGDSFVAVGANCPTDADATGTTVMTATGTPLDTFDIRVLITRAGASLAAATAAFKVSVDGGNSYGDEIGMPVAGSYAIPDTGVTLAFAAGTFVAGDHYRLRTAAPIWSTVTLDAALDALVTSGRDFEFVHVAGEVSGASVGTVTTWLTERAAAGQYVGAVCEARDQAHGESAATWQTALTGASPGFLAVSHTGLMNVGASHSDIQSALRSGVYWRRNSARLLSARLASIPIREHPGRVKSGPVVGLKPDGNTSSVHHDLRTYTGLDLARFGGIQTIAGRPRGEYYFTSRTMAGATSDFSEVQRIRVMHAAAQAGLAAVSEYVGDDVAVKSDGTGQIAEAEAKAIEAEVLAKVKAAVMSSANEHVSAVSVHVTRTNNILSTRQLLVAISVTPKGSINTVTTTIRFSLGGAAS